MTQYAYAALNLGDHPAAARPARLEGPVTGTGTGTGTGSSTGVAGPSTPTRGTPAARCLEDPPDVLRQLLHREFEQESLARSLGLPDSSVPGRVWDRALRDPISRFFETPGKQVRARLMEQAFDLAGGMQKPLFPEAPLLVEILHAGSLIIDDVEDGSQVRRGRPALHTEVGVPIAVNAGNWLYFWPMELLPRMNLRPEVELSLFRAVSQSIFRCHYGQALDLSTDVRRLARDEVPGIVEATTRLKTGSLFELAAIVGATLAGASNETVQRIGSLGRDMGIGLQMLDDLSGICNERRKDKGHEDLLSGRPTWPWAWIAKTIDDGSFSKLQRMGLELDGSRTTQALTDALKSGLGTDGSRSVRDHLQSTASKLMSDFEGSPAAQRMASEIEGLEQAYG